jgi:hypothetical protein
MRVDARQANEEMSRELARLEDGGFVIDLSKPPYEVPCPVCYAYALAPCRSERRRVDEFGYPYRLMRGEKPPGKVLEQPHSERWKHWRDHPEFRARAISYEPVGGK